MSKEPAVPHWNGYLSVCRKGDVVVACNDFILLRVTAVGEDSCLAKPVIASTDPNEREIAPMAHVLRYRKGEEGDRDHQRYEYLEPGEGIEMSGDLGSWSYYAQDGTFRMYRRERAKEKLVAAEPTTRSLVVQYWEFAIQKEESRRLGVCLAAANTKISELRKERDDAACHARMNLDSLYATQDALIDARKEISTLKELNVPRCPICPRIVKPPKEPNP